MALENKNAKDADGGIFALGFETEDSSLARRVFNKTLNTLLGTTSDAASATGTLMGRLGFIAANLSGGSSPTTTYVEFDDTASVTATATDVVTVDTRGFDTLCFQLQNTGSGALADLQLHFRFNSALAGFYNPITYSNDDWTQWNGKQSNNSQADVLKSGGSQTPLDLAAGASFWAIINCRGVESLKLTAKTASGSTTLLVHGVVE